MTEPHALMPTIYAGWHTYQTQLITALTLLVSDQLALRAAPTLRSIEDIARHMIGARARWFYKLMGEGGEEFADLSTLGSPRDAKPQCCRTGSRLGDDVAGDAGCDRSLDTY